jgi:hypothetical protein
MRQVGSVLGACIKDVAYDNNGYVARFNIPGYPDSYFIAKLNSNASLLKSLAFSPKR